MAFNHLQSQPVRPRCRYAPARTRRTGRIAPATPRGTGAIPARPTRDIAQRCQAKVTSVAPTRSALIAKGMTWRPNHGDTAFTVPMFDAFMKRLMPEADWRTA